MSEIHVAAVQMAMSGQRDADIARAMQLATEAANSGARIVLLPELFDSHYFCVTQDEAIFATAAPVASHPAVQAARETARTAGIFLPVSFFERDGPHYYNSLAFVNADGSVQGVYRKSHIPDGPGYQEKFYFRPGNTGFRVWDTPDGRVGVGICWDQWYPETARALMLMGAELLMFPTAIGSEPHDPDLDTRRMWVRAMVGHAVSNVVPVVAANRIGTEPTPDGQGQSYYGNSFICNERGDMVAEMDANQEDMIAATFDLAQVAAHRAAFGFFRDRRPGLYQRLVEDR